MTVPDRGGGEGCCVRGGWTSLWILTGSAHHPVNESASGLIEGLQILARANALMSAHGNRQAQALAWPVSSSGPRGEGLGYRVLATSDIILSYELWACLALYQVSTT